MSIIGVVASATGGVEQLREGMVAPLVDRVRSQPRRPGEPRPHPPIDVFVAAPVSANTVAKLALGIGDNQALSVLSEGLGSTPMVVFPRVNAAHARHPAWAGHVETLRRAGVELIEWELLKPRAADGRELPWPASSLPSTS
jgi:Flavoprotein